MDQKYRLTKAIIPVAGLGTRFLPASKVIPKEMLPVIEKPAVQYVLEVLREAISLYGCVVTSGQEADNMVNVSAMVEKPTIEEAPSNLAIIGRYVLDPAIFGILEKTAPGRKGEIQLTDALQTLATLDSATGGGVRGVKFTGRRYDTGNPLEYLKAVVQLGVARQDFGSELKTWLKKYVANI